MKTLNNQSEGFFFYPCIRAATHEWLNGQNQFTSWWGVIKRCRKPQATYPMNEYNSGRGKKEGRNFDIGYYCITRHYLATRTQGEWVRVSG